MKQSFVWLVVLLCFAVSTAGAQSAKRDSINATYSRRNVVSLNMTPLLTQLVPFNRADPNEAGPFLVRFKRYGTVGTSAFRFSMGIHVREVDGDEPDDLQLNIAVGWEKRR